jgi:hypothetical protein
MGKSETVYFNIMLFPHLGASDDDLNLAICQDCEANFRAAIEVVLESLRKTRPAEVLP